MVRRRLLLPFAASTATSPVRGQPVVSSVARFQSGGPVPPESRSRILTETTRIPRLEPTAALFPYPTLDLVPEDTKEPR